MKDTPNYDSLRYQNTDRRVSINVFQNSPKYLEVRKKSVVENINTISIILVGLGMEVKRMEQRGFWVISNLAF